MSLVRDFLRRWRAPAVGDVLTLRGGPMANWVVPPDAPCLREGWYETIPEHLRRRHAVKPGRYVAMSDGTARWVER